MSNNWPKVAIIILNWNGWKDTVECLESVFRNSYPNYQVIVVDNGSTNDSIGKIKAWAEGKQKELTPEITHPLYNLSHPPVQKPIPYIEYDKETVEGGGILEKEKLLYDKLQKNILYPLILIQTGENMGFAAGNNIGIKFAIKKGADYILLLNNDTVVSNDILGEIVNFAECNQEVGIVGPKIVFYNMPNKTAHGAGFVDNKGRIITKDVNEQIECDFVTGACILIKRAVFKKIEQLPEDYFLYWEDVEFCIQANKNNYKIYYLPAINIAHKVSQSTISGSNFSTYYMIRNRILFAKKYNKFPQKIISLSYLLFIYVPHNLLSSLKHFRERGIEGIFVVLISAFDGFSGRTGKRYKRR